jgi:16S rRNA (uracil1498-N3)-methyltransferase
MRRFFVNTKAVKDGGVTITGTDVHHIRDVLRLQPGDRIVCIDESAAEHTVAISTLAEDRVIGRIESTERPSVPTVELALFQGLPKGTKFDYVVEKATELGADRIAPVLMERTVPRIDAAAGKRAERWRRVAEAAAKQCRRPTLPRVDAPLKFSEFTEVLTEYDLVILFWEGATEPVDGIIEGFTGRKAAIVIGPEGGLAVSEVAQLVDSGAKAAWLGPRILRTETAPIVALAIVNHLLGR